MDQMIANIRIDMKSAKVLCVGFTVEIISLFTHIHVHTYIYTCTHTYIYTYRHVHTYTHIYIYIYIYIYIPEDHRKVFLI